MSTNYSINSISRMSLEEQTWESLFQKGKMCQEDSDNVEALLYYKLSLEQFLKHTPGDSLQKVKILKSLIRLCYDQSKFSQSLQYSTQLKDLLQKNNQINTEDYAFAFEKISGARYCLGHLKESQKSYLKTIPLYERLKGNDSIEVVGLRIFLGQVYRRYSQIDKALEEYEKCQGICSNRPQQNFSMQLSKVYSEMAEIYRQKSDLLRSFDYVQKSMKIWDSLGREQTMDKCTNLICLIQLYLSNKQIKDAKEGLSKLKEIIKRNNGIQSINYANALIMEGNIFVTLGSFKGGVDYYTSALNVIENIYGKESLYSNYPLDGLSIAFQKLDIKSQAIKYASLSYINSLRFLGEEHSITQKKKQRLDNLKNNRNKT